MRHALLKTLSSLALFATLSFAQTASSIQQPVEKPLPDIPTLMHEVETHQHDSETIQKDYIFHEVVTQRESKGKTENREFDVFWLHGVEVHKLTRKNGRDLTEDEKKKEDERIDKEVAKAKNRKSHADAKGQETDSQGHDIVTVSRFLALGSFTNPRRLQVDGRDTIAVDYTGDPKAKTRNRLEDIIRSIAGTIWIDEQDRVISRLEGHFASNYKVGGGLMITVKKDTSFSMEQKKINGEVWLPAQAKGQGAARVLLFVNFDGSVHFAFSDYRKFKATSTILPGVSTVSDASPDAAASPSSSEKTAADPQ
ncbi:MAG: hypothetical protein JST61_03315 [Acidobacteria bacterium]|nr:hypothetical protein [Acidobacteriota bacterium]